MAASLQHLGRGALRVAKNYTKGYTDTQTKVRDATSNDPWGPSGTQMNEIAQMTYNQSDFVEIMEMMDKRLNDRGKNWRHVFKALTLLDYCLHAGSENVVIYFKDNIYIVKTLKEFVHVDDAGKDVGANVRQKAKDITNLLQDEQRLRDERRSRGAMRDRMLGNIENSGLKGETDYGEGPRSPVREPARRPPAQSRNEDDDLKRAIEESKRMSEDEAKRRSQVTQEEDDLRRALRMSEEEEARRKREQEESTKNALFDDNLNIQSQNAYQQQPDLFAQQTQQMPMQPTGGWPLVDVGWGQQQMQPQYTSYNPFHAQMLQQQQQQQQQEEYMRQQMALQEQQRQQQEWMQQQAFLQQQNTSLLAQPTGYGSNNPFAPGGGQHQPQQQAASPQPSSSFLPVPVVTQQQQPTSPQPLEPQQTAKPAWTAPKKDDGQHSQLANLLARGREDGMDTFGNTGVLRIPIGSQFAQSNRLAIQQQATGFGANNPFGQPQQQQQQQQKPNDQPFFSI
ncbi:hypothetical protein CI109_103553 [Kwoniella shandongensis]|uniref:Uncharacterized protein n=1 Tax=Kwoniella shandongensis TaxID=1734106 RepID=A0A5M6BXU9_9TREE|nr:uncharacterized protein CI109_004545 [Kwoniella shandongensis]KAA5527010.1 hypothetical protein CI109_004545 [Kwoniella shandongensis]